MSALKEIKNGFLFQKCGYIFEELKSDFGFSDMFNERCKKKSSNVKRYLIKKAQETNFNEKWKLYTSLSLKKVIDKGLSDYDAIG